MVWNRYEVWDPDSSSTIYNVTGDIIWLKRMYFIHPTGEDEEAILPTDIEHSLEPTEEQNTPPTQEEPKADEHESELESEDEEDPVIV